jgi:hypothetical protein
VRSSRVTKRRDHAHKIGFGALKVVQLSRAGGDAAISRPRCAPRRVAVNTAGSAGPDSATPAAAAPARSRQEPRVHEAAIGAVRPSSRAVLHIVL